MGAVSGRAIRGLVRGRRRARTRPPLRSRQLAPHDGSGWTTGQCKSGMEAVDYLLASQSSLILRGGLGLMPAVPPCAAVEAGPDMLVR